MIKIYITVKTYINRDIWRHNRDIWRHNRDIRRHNREKFFLDFVSKNDCPSFWNFLKSFYLKRLVMIDKNIDLDWFNKKSSFHKLNGIYMPCTILYKHELFQFQMYRSTPRFFFLKIFWSLLKFLCGRLACVWRSLVLSGHKKLRNLPN